MQNSTNNQGENIGTLEEPADTHSFVSHSV